MFQREENQQRTDEGGHKAPDNKLESGGVGESEKGISKPQ
jgi:hypothetical protein